MSCQDPSPLLSGQQSGSISETVNIASGDENMMSHESPIRGRSAARPDSGSEASKEAHHETQTPSMPRRSRGSRKPNTGTRKKIELVHASQTNRKDLDGKSFRVMATSAFQWWLDGYNNLISSSRLAAVLVILILLTLSLSIQRGIKPTSIASQGDYNDMSSVYVEGLATCDRSTPAYLAQVPQERNHCTDARSRMRVFATDNSLFQLLLKLEDTYGLAAAQTHSLLKASAELKSSHIAVFDLHVTIEDSSSAIKTKKRLVDLTYEIARHLYRLSNQFENISHSAVWSNTELGVLQQELLTSLENLHHDIKVRNTAKGWRLISIKWQMYGLKSQYELLAAAVRRIEETARAMSKHANQGMKHVNKIEKLIKELDETAVTAFPRDHPIGNHESNYFQRLWYLAFKHMEQQHPRIKITPHLLEQHFENSDGLLRREKWAKTVDLLRRTRQEFDAISAAASILAKRTEMRPEQDEMKWSEEEIQRNIFLLKQEQQEDTEQT
jgi:hypothetical protein